MFQYEKKDEMEESKGSVVIQQTVFFNFSPQCGTGQIEYLGT
jgi:hypothetical protein